MTRQELINAMTVLIGPDNAMNVRPILAHVLKVKQEDLVKAPNVRASRWNAKRAMRLARKRAAGAPLAYLTGTRWFYGKQFSVNKHTLIPRPETELLVEVAIQHLEPKASNLKPLVIDVGTGSGAIAISLAATTSTRVIATDISRRALRVAHKNAKQHRVENDVVFRQGSLLDPLAAGDVQKRDELITIANLPYLTERELNDGRRTDVANELVHEPTSALVSDDNDGLDLYRGLLRQIQERRKELPDTIVLLLEMNPDQTAACTNEIKRYFPRATTETKNDLSGRPRCIAATIKKASPTSPGLDTSRIDPRPSPEST